jgi:hypothetical protein
MNNLYARRKVAIPEPLIPDVKRAIREFNVVERQAVRVAKLMKESERIAERDRARLAAKG